MLDKIVEDLSNTFRKTTSLPLWVAAALTLVLWVFGFVALFVALVAGVAGAALERAQDVSTSTDQAENDTQVLHG